MKITLFDSRRHIKETEIINKTVVVIDVLRTSATIIAALQNGCTRIIPVANVDEMVEVKRLSESDVLLCGDSGINNLQDFDLSNSPAEYERSVIQEKILALYSVDGTTTLKKAENAKNVLIGTFLNADAVAKKILELGDDVYIICSGIKNEFAIDDCIAAGCIISRIIDHDKSVELEDFGELATRFYISGRLDILRTVKLGEKAKKLTRIGFESDIEYCVREDVTDIVPIFKESMIIL